MSLLLRKLSSQNWRRTRNTCWLSSGHFQDVGQTVFPNPKHDFMIFTSLYKRKWPGAIHSKFLAAFILIREKPSTFVLYHYGSTEIMISIRRLSESLSKRGIPQKSIITALDGVASSSWDPPYLSHGDQQSDNLRVCLLCLRVPMNRGLELSIEPMCSPVGHMRLNILSKCSFELSSLTLLSLCPHH